MATLSNLPNSLKVWVAQLNPQLGAIHNNAAAIRMAAVQGAQAGADIVLLPEQSLTGYPLLDLARREDFVAYAFRKAHELARTLPPHVHVIFGGVEPTSSQGPHGQLAYNVVFVAHGGKIVATSRKGILPIAGEFDEPRLFRTGTAAIIKVNGIKVGLPICEDIWHTGVVRRLKARGAQVLLVPNASPSYVAKWTVRHLVASERVKESGLPLAYCNMVGGQDEFLFDGGSFAMNPGNPEPVRIMPYWQEAGQLWELVPNGEGYAFTGGEQVQANFLEHTVRGLELGLADYLRKTGAGRNGIVLGLSGGVDSALAAVVAVKALGPGKVHCFRLPSKFTSEESMTLAQDLADNLGIGPALRTIDIWPTFMAQMNEIEQGLGQRLTGVAAENLQSGIRANTLLRIANQMFCLVLGTGNWSETSQGYMTQGGDAVSGLNILKGLPKMLIFELCRYYNREAGGELIPLRIIERPPSAELAEGQKDSDSLPPYEILDAILDRYIAQSQSVPEIVAAGFDEATVRSVVRRLFLSEFKRRITPGLRVTRGSFDRARDFPIACHREAWELESYQPPLPATLAA